MKASHGDRSLAGKRQGRAEAESGCRPHMRDSAVSQQPAAMLSYPDKLLPVQEGRIAITLTCARGLPDTWPKLAQNTQRLIGQGVGRSEQDGVGWVGEAAFVLGPERADPVTFRTRVSVGPEPRWEEFRSVSVSATSSSKVCARAIAFA